MYISKIEIENYRNFKQFEMDLHPFTLIIGENNIGKTNLINALSLILSQEITIYRKRTLEIDDINYEIVKKFKETVLGKSKKGEQLKASEFPRVKVSIELVDFNADQEAVIADWFIDKDLSRARVSYEFYPIENNKLDEWFQEIKKSEPEEIEDISFPINLYRYKIFGGYDETKQIDFYFLNMIKMEYLDALRDADKEMASNNEYRLLSKILKNRAQTADNFSEIKDALKKLQQEIKTHRDVKDILQEISDKLNVISFKDEGSNVVDFKFSKFEITELFKRLSLQYGVDPIDISRNGLGRNNLLYIALVLSHLENVPNHNNYTFFHLLGIEEPEAHLHPHLQKHLSFNIHKQLCEKFNTTECEKEKVKGKYKCDRKCQKQQLLMTTHSTHISSHLPLQYTAVLFNDKKRKAIANKYIVDGVGEDHVVHLRKYLDATNSTMFYARKIIFVEGVAEELLIPKLFQMQHKTTMEAEGISLVNVRGISFKHFLEVIKSGYFVKCLVFTDQDSGTKTEERADKLKEEYEKIDSSLFRIEISIQQTFEKDIFEANKENKESRAILLRALKACKPTVGTNMKSKYKSKTLNVDEFYGKMHDSKANFALMLASEINDKLSIPKYIKNGFEYLLKQDETEKDE